MLRHGLTVVTLAAWASCQADTLVRDLGRATGAAAGIAASIYVHELGHATAFHLQGADEITIHVPGDHCRLMCGTTRARFTHPITAEEARWGSVAGLLAANIASEAALDRRSVARSTFGQGFIAANLYSNVSHVYTYYTRRVGVDGYSGNDIDNFEAEGGNPHLLSAALIGYSLYSVKRMHDRGLPLFFVNLRF